MSLPQTTKAVLFDMDGVLWLSTPIHAQAFQQVLHAEGISDFDYTKYAGMTTKETLSHVFASRGVAISAQRISELSAKKSELALAALAEKPPLAPDCIAVLAALSGRYPLALASSASPGTVKLFLQASGCGHYFRATLDRESVEHPKPAPDIYLKACYLLSVEPASALVIEDAVSGIVAGKAAGMPVWALPTTCTEAALLAAGADRVLQNLGDLL